MDLKEPKQVRWGEIKNAGENSESSSFVNNDQDQVLASSSSSFSSSSCLSSSSDVADDASSSSTADGPLYELADLMAQLPIRRSLSKFYNGKSQTFASLSEVASVEDLGKKEMKCVRRVKSCKTYAGNLHKLGPKATITKRSPRITS